MIVADTHAVIWWATASADLSRRASDAMTSTTIGVAGITIWEAARLSFRRRIVIPEELVLTWLQKLVQLPEISLLPITPEIAVVAAKLPDTVRDPADRLIVATALHHDAPLVTKDGRIRESGVVQTIW